MHATGRIRVGIRIRIWVRVRVGRAFLSDIDTGGDFFFFLDDAWAAHDHWPVGDVVQPRVVLVRVIKSGSSSVGRPSMHVDRRAKNE